MTVVGRIVGSGKDDGLIGFCIFVGIARFVPRVGDNGGSKNSIHMRREDFDPSYSE